MISHPSQAIAAASVVALLLLFSSCGKQMLSGNYEITEVRDLDPEHAYEQPELTANSADRFGYTTKQPENSDDTAVGLAWDVPEEWKEVAKTSMRDANMRFGLQDEGECYVTRLAGGGGGLTANVNRWRGQMGLDDLDDAAVAALPKKPMFGYEATFLSLDGTFAGMGQEGKVGYRMLGLILTAGDGALFVKMTGPRDLVAAHAERFDAFCQSLRVSGAPH